MKKGFTLIEIIIVIVILSVLMTITLRFGSGRIDELKYQNTKEQFVSAYEKLYSQNMTSNYNNGTRYETLNIKLEDNQNQIFYSFDSGDRQRSYIQGQLAITGVQQTTLTLKPYTLGCQIDDLTGGTVDLNILVENAKIYCFTINANTCKLIEKLCEIK